MNGQGSASAKSTRIRNYVMPLAHEEQYRAIKLLLPNKSHDHRTYQLKDKSLLGHLASILGCSALDMATHLETSGCVGTTAEAFCPAQYDLGKKLTLECVDTYLDRLAVPASDR